MLRDRIARALPAWPRELPGRHALLGMLAFGLEEMGDYAAAEAAGREAVELERRDAWARHAVAHVMEMQGRTNDGIAWMHADIEAWTEDNFFAVHNWWHLALYHLEFGEVEEVLRLFDGPIHGARSQVMVDMIDAAALLWRLHLRGIDVGERWQTVADVFAPAAGSGNYAFNDLHAMIAFTGAGRRDLAEQLLAAQQTAMAQPDDNAGFTRDVGHAAASAVQAFGNERYDEVVALIRPIRNIAHRFGGSHAQRDVLDLTLIEAAFRCGQHDLARALTAERLATKPTSPLTGLFAQRLGEEALRSTDAPSHRSI